MLISKALDARLEVGLEQQAELMLKMMSTLEADSILQALTNISPTCNFTQLNLNVLYCYGSISLANTDAVKFSLLLLLKAFRWGLHISWNHCRSPSYLDDFLLELPAPGWKFMEICEWKGEVW